MHVGDLVKGDLIKTYNDPRWAIVIKAWRMRESWAGVQWWVVEFIYPGGQRDIMPERLIRDVIHVSRQD